MIATDLLRWFALLCLGRRLPRAEPKTLRYRLLHTAARIVRGQPNASQNSETRPWACELAAGFVLAFALTPDLTRRPPDRPTPTRGTPAGPWNRRHRRDRRPTDHKHYSTR